MVWYSVGESSYGDLHGVEQFVNSLRIAQQFLSLKRDFDALQIKKGSGDRLSPNEAKRSRARQTSLYQNYLRAGYPVAALPFTSRHDEVLHGNAVDVGVTTADGGNRALTSAEFTWMHNACQQRGFTWTGVNFGEPWHIEGATRVEVLPPYPGISVANATPSAGVKSAKKTVSGVASVEEEDVYLLKNKTTGDVFTAAKEYIHHVSSTAEVLRLKRLLGAPVEFNTTEMHTVLGGLGVPTQYSVAKVLVKDHSDGTWSLAKSVASKVGA